MVGSTLSHYKITAEIGRGGMGIVYRADDTKLNRTVAIKVLPSAALSSKDDRARFYREAQAAAQLHHAHIATVFEIDEAVPNDAPHGTAPSPFIVMEFIDGETLSTRVSKGPLKLADSIRIASEMASALDAAHEKNIVHRDIKSGNVMLTKKNEAKVLDFGLAKTAQSTKLTRLGATLGTVAYMSPEQARGEEVDSRSDLYSLGTVLYEMITGRLPFSAEYEQAAIYSILNEDPEPLTAVRSGVPMALESVVFKLLRKDRDLRYQTARDLIADLKSIDLRSGLRTMTTTTTIASAPDAAAMGGSNTVSTTSKRSLALGAAVLTVVLLAFFAGRYFQAPPNGTYAQTAIRTTETIKNLGIGVVSPDGSRVIFEVNDTLWTRRLSTNIVTPVAKIDQVVRTAFWSPTSDRFVFIDGDIVRSIRPDGSNEIRIGRIPPAERIQGGLWTPDDSLLIVVTYGGANQEVVSFPASGGNYSSWLTLSSASGDYMITDITYHAPTGSVVATTLETQRDFGQFSVRILNPATDKQRSLDDAIRNATRTERSLTFVEIDHDYLLMGRDRSVWILPVNPGSLEPTGPIRMLTSGLTGIRVGSNGLLAGLTAAENQSVQIVLIDPETLIVSPVGQVDQSINFPSINASGTRLMGANRDGTIIMDLQRAGTRRIYDPVAAPSEWLPGDTGILVSHYFETGGANILVLDPDGIDEAQTLVDGPESEFYPTLSPDEKTLLYYQTSPETGRDLWVVDVDVINGRIELSGTPHLWYSASNDDVIPRWHPSGNLVLYAANHTGESQIYIRDYPTARNEQRVSVEEGFDPAWSPKGDRIYYRGRELFHAVDVLSTNPLRLSEPREILNMDDMRLVHIGQLTRSYAVHPITGQLLFNQRSRDANESEMVFITDWRALLEDN